MLSADLILGRRGRVRTRQHDLRDWLAAENEQSVEALGLLNGKYRALNHDSNCKNKGKDVHGAYYLVHG